MKTVRLMSAVRVFGKLTLLSSTFLLGVFATAMFAAILDSAAASSPAQPSPPAMTVEQTSFATPPTVEQQPAISSESEALASDAWPDIPPLALSRGRTLLTRGAMLHMLDENNQVLWSWTAGGSGWPFITDQPLVDSSGTVHIIGSDLTHIALNGSTGQEEWRDTASGRAEYAQIEHYKDGQYLVLFDMSGYDETLGYRPENKLIAYKGQDLVWSTGFPRDAKLVVRGSKIYALFYNENGLEMREINPSDGEFSCSC